MDGKQCQRYKIAIVSTCEDTEALKLKGFNNIYISNADYLHFHSNQMGTEIGALEFQRGPNEAKDTKSQLFHHFEDTGPQK